MLIEKIRVFKIRCFFFSVSFLRGFWIHLSDSDADAGGKRGGGRAADPTLRGHFVNRIREEEGDRNTLPG